MEGMKKKVFCKGCAYLLLIEGKAALCVATAKSVSGPIHSTIDVIGVKIAEERNKRNNCKLWKSKWAVFTSFQDGMRKKAMVQTFLGIPEISIRKYTVSDERAALIGLRKRENLEIQIEQGNVVDTLLVANSQDIEEEEKIDDRPKVEEKENHAEEPGGLKEAIRETIESSIPLEEERREIKTSPVQLAPQKNIRGKITERDIDNFNPC